MAKVALGHSSRGPRVRQGRSKPTNQGNRAGILLGSVRPDSLQIIYLNATADTRKCRRLGIRVVRECAPGRVPAAE